MHHNLIFALHSGLAYKSQHCDNIVVKIYSKPKAYDFVNLLISFYVSNVRFDSFAIIQVLLLATWFKPQELIN